MESANDWKTGCVNLALDEGRDVDNHAAVSFGIIKKLTITHTFPLLADNAHMFGMTPKTLVHTITLCSTITPMPTIRASTSRTATTTNQISKIRANFGPQEPTNARYQPIFELLCQPPP